MMGKLMKAVVCRGPNQYALESIPVPEVGENDVLIKVEGCGICAGDAKAQTGAVIGCARTGTTLLALNLT